MGVGAGLYVYDVVIKKFTFTISHLLIRVCCGSIEGYLRYSGRYEVVSINH